MVLPPHIIVWGFTPSALRDKPTHVHAAHPSTHPPTQPASHPAADTQPPPTHPPTRPPVKGSWLGDMDLFSLATALRIGCGTLKNVGMRKESPNYIPILTLDQDAFVRKPESHEAPHINIPTPSASTAKTTPLAQCALMPLALHAQKVAESDVARSSFQSQAVYIHL